MGMRKATPIVLIALIIAILLIHFAGAGTFFNYYRLMNGDKVLVDDGEIFLGRELAIFKRDASGFVSIFRAGSPDGEVATIYPGHDRQLSLAVKLKKAPNLIRYYEFSSRCAVYEFSIETGRKFVLLIGGMQRLVEIEGLLNSDNVSVYCNGIIERE